MWTTVDGKQIAIAINLEQISPNMFQLNDTVGESNQ
jgi:hypothetical protein